MSDVGYDALGSKCASGRGTCQGILDGSWDKVINSTKHEMDGQLLACLIQVFDRFSRSFVVFVHTHFFLAGARESVSTFAGP